VGKGKFSRVSGTYSSTLNMVIAQSDSDLKNFNECLENRQRSPARRKGSSVFINN
jgi:hypothetical protein